MFPGEYYEIFKNYYFEEHLRTAASVKTKTSMKVILLPFCCILADACPMGIVLQIILVIHLMAI